MVIRAIALLISVGSPVLVIGGPMSYVKVSPIMEMTNAINQTEAYSSREGVDHRAV